jgi:hypothetical protein
MAGHDVDEIPIDACAKCRNQFIETISIGHDRNSPPGVAAPEKLDLFDRGVKIFASVDNETQLLAWLALASG